MSRLSDIPIRIEVPEGSSSAALETEGLGQGGSAIFVELLDLLERLASSDLPGAIDLHSLPMSDDDRVRLQARLGRGEVRAFIDAEGVSEIQETAVPGIWWIQHRDKNFELVAELLEVTKVPSILSRSSDEISAGLALMRERMGFPRANRIIAPQYGQ